MPGDWLTETELGEEYGISPRTLAQWRYQGEGPEYAKLGGHVRYQRSAVEKWAAERIVKPSRTR